MYLFNIMKSSFYVIRHGKSYSNYYRDNNMYIKLNTTVDPLHKIKMEKMEFYK